MFNYANVKTAIKYSWLLIVSLLGGSYHSCDMFVTALFNLEANWVSAKDVFKGHYF